jgi:hypothetical protein
VLAANFAVDILNGVIDPRIRAAQTLVGVIIGLVSDHGELQQEWAGIASQPASR